MLVSNPCADAGEAKVRAENVLTQMFRDITAGRAAMDCITILNAHRYRIILAAETDNDAVNGAWLLHWGSDARFWRALSREPKQLSASIFIGQAPNGIVVLEKLIDGPESIHINNVCDSVAHTIHTA